MRVGCRVGTPFRADRVGRRVGGVPQCDHCRTAAEIRADDDRIDSATLTRDGGRRLPAAARRYSRDGYRIREQRHVAARAPLRLSTATRAGDDHARPRIIRSVAVLKSSHRLLETLVACTNEL